MQLTILICLTLTNCRTSNVAIEFEKVKNGNQLERAIEISVNYFFQIWMSNRYPSKIDLNCHELFKDSIFTYFGENSLKALSINQNLYKVNNDSLRLYFPNYANIDGEFIRQEFWERIVPTNDKKIRKTADCKSSSSNPRFKYQLVETKIKINLEWKYKCDGKTLIDKAYQSYFDMDKLEILK